MDVGFDGAFRPAQQVRDLVVWESLDVVEDDCLAVAAGEGGDQRAQLGRFRVAVATRLWDTLERHRVTMRPQAVPKDVQGDPVQPGAGLQLLPALLVPAGKRFVGPEEGLLGDLFRVGRVTAKVQGEPEDAVLVSVHELLEGHPLVQLNTRAGRRVASIVGLGAEDSWRARGTRLRVVSPFLIGARAAARVEPG